MRLPIAGMILAVLVLGGAAVTTVAAGALRISGTGSGVGGLALAGKAFEAARPGSTVAVLPNLGSSGAIKALIDGRLELAVSARPLTDAEQAAGLVAEPYARTAIAFGAEATTPDAELTLEDVEKIYARRTTTWNDGRPIRLVLRPAADSVTIRVAALGAGIKSALDAASAVPGVFVGVTEQDAADHIARTRGAFGAVSLSLVLAERRAIKLLALDGAAPTVENVAAGRYRLTLDLYLVHRRTDVPPVVREFVDFVRTGAGRAVLEANGHQALGAETAPPPQP